MRYKVWGILFVVSLIGFILAEKAFTIDPDVTSGNGNLGLLFIFALFPFFIASYVATAINTKQLLAEKSTRKLSGRIIFLCLISFVFLTLAAVDYANDLIAALGGPPTDANSRIYRFGWLNQYTNSLFFNVYTFGLTQILSIAAGVLLYKAARNPQKIS